MNIPGKAGHKKRIVIYGWYGAPNLGDEAILASIVADFRRLFSNIHITVFSNDPVYTQLNHNVDNSVYAKLPLSKEQNKSLTTELRKADLFILGGGGIFHTHSGRRPWLNSLALAKLFGCKTMLYAVGIDPSSIDKPRRRLVWRFFSLFADQITVRDEGSRDLLQKAGVCKSITVLPDPGFRLVPSPTKFAKQVLKRTINDYEGKIVCFGIGISPFLDKSISRLEYIRIISFTADYVVEQLNARVLLIPYDTQPGRDIEMCLEVIGMMRKRENGYVLLDEQDPRMILSLFSLMDLSLCTRLHSLIFSIRMATPFVSIIHTQKVEELLKGSNLLSFGIKLSELNSDMLIHKINDVWQKREEIRRELYHLSLSYKEEALQTPELVRNML